MNKHELAQAVSKKSGLSKRESSELLNRTLSVLSGILINQDSLTIQNFGTFKVELKKERRFFNPFKLKMMIAPPKLAVTFHPSKAFTDRVNKGGENGQ